MIVFCDPSNNQVMAVYSGKTTSTTWTDQGFVEVEIPKELETNVTRDSYLEFDAGGRVEDIIRRVNTVMPKPNTSEAVTLSLREKLDNDTITNAELRELLRLRGL